MEIGRAFYAQDHLKVHHYQIMRGRGHFWFCLSGLLRIRPYIVLLSTLSFTTNWWKELNKILGNLSKSPLGAISLEKHFQSDFIFVAVFQRFDIWRCTTGVIFLLGRVHCTFVFPEHHDHIFHGGLSWENNLHGNRPECPPYQRCPWDNFQSCRNFAHF